MTKSRTDLTLADVARLEDIVDRASLAEVCRSFFELFSLPIRVFSRDGTLLADVHEARAICRYVNTLPAGRSACSAHVGEVKDLDPENGPVVHSCFTGAVYRVVPIDYQGRRLGRFVVGPYLPAEVQHVPRSLLVLDPSLEQERAREALGEMPRVRKETAERLVAHLSRVLDLIVFSGHRAFLTSEMHVASVRESYRELAEKTEKLQHAYDKLRELDRLKSNFLATVSHELRTPLTSILGYSDMLAAGIAGPLNDEQREFVETIHSKGDQLLALITSLLDLNKLEQGRMDIHVEPVDVRTLIHDVAKTVAPQAAKKQITLELELADELPVVSADPIRLRQVLSNLVDNALKFSPEGARVVVAARPAELEGNADGMGIVLMAPVQAALELEVRDEGPGIPESERERIFDAFYQIDGGSTREHGGTGLGLSIVKRLVEAHRGEVSVESGPGRGSTFRVRIPVSPEL